MSWPEARAAWAAAPTLLPVVPPLSTVPIDTAPPLASEVLTPPLPALPVSCAPTPPTSRRWVGRARARRADPPPRVARCTLAYTWRRGCQAEHPVQQSALP